MIDYLWRGSGHMRYDVIIIGAGPGGIFAAYELMKKKPDCKIAVFEEGYPLEKRKCPIDGKKIKSCVGCKRCSIMCGFGGAGAFSDGKYNITNDFGGTLFEYIGKEKAVELMKYVDEINMAKNDAVSVLHATLDYRRSIDVPGYDRIDLHPAARFIGTMNYGYAGTKELNEALVSRFLVIDMPAQTEETLGFIFRKMFPEAKEKAVEQFIGVFMDLQKKSVNSEISTKALDLRGLLAAMKIVRAGLSPLAAVQMGVVNKTFDIFEKEIVDDVVRTRIPEEWTKDDVYA